MCGPLDVPLSHIFALRSRIPTICRPHTQVPFGWCYLIFLMLGWYSMGIGYFFGAWLGPLMVGACEV